MRSTAAHRWFHYTQLPDGSEYLCWPQLFEFLMASDGRRITGHALRSITSTTFQTYLLTQVLSFVLVKCGVEPLHATTVVINGGAVALLGDCGYGKSTLAAACLKAGYPLLTDDLLVLTRDGARLLAFPGPPRIKLMPWVAKRLLGCHAQCGRLNPLTTKWVIPLRVEQHENSPVPLKAIYTLSPPRIRRHPAGVTIQRHSAQAAWVELTKGTFNLVVRDSDRLRRQFAWATELAQRVPVKRLTIPRSLQALPEAVATLVGDVTNET